ncbi:MAG: DNA-processing protein DprA [Ignavibacteriae bacterium]|nr:DNA-processing protein DprA [Ignavibacteriota bacterium]MCB9243013.1 DNA-protecting protein DprA [Ignavibacteriales bacterium]
MSEFRKIDGFDIGIISDLSRVKDKQNLYEDEFNKILDKCDADDVKMVSILDEDYPVNLRTIFDAPVLLYYKGSLNENDKYSLSVVGTRVPTEYGKIICKQLVEGISELGIPIISGMANGIDTVAHMTALDCGNITYAVLGSGLDVIYPPENVKLYEKITQSGAVISELDFGSIPDRVNFPRRNRIICGISLGTLVVESGAKGGSLITAQLALDQNREVFAVPGYANSKKSSGTNELIKRGYAKMVTNVDDILSELEYKVAPLVRKPKDDMNEELIRNLNIIEKQIYVKLDYQPMNIDAINMETGLPVSDCLVNLLSLELKGLVRQIPGKNFIKV